MGPPCRFLFVRPKGYMGSTPLAVMFGTPVPFRLQDLCSLMDTSLKVLLRDEDEEKEWRKCRQEENNIPFAYESSTELPLWALSWSYYELSRM